MRLDHLLSKETSISETPDRNILVSRLERNGVTLFNLEGTRCAREIRGDIAQLGERLPCKQEVAGSIPTISTKENTGP